MEQCCTKHKGAAYIAPNSSFEVLVLQIARECPHCEQGAQTQGHRHGPGEAPEFMLPTRRGRLAQTEAKNVSGERQSEDFKLNSGQALVLQKSWRISACQVSFLTSSEVLSPSDTSRI